MDTKYSPDEKMLLEKLGYGIEEIEAGTLLILACMAGRSFARMWKPKMNNIPHCGTLPREEYILNRDLPIEVDETFNLNGRPWLILK